MKIETTYPPHYEAIKAAFPAVAESHSVVFTHGDTLHNPHETDIRPDLMFHESVHARQQRNKPDEWWKRYMSDPEFRLAQEVEAYSEQYRFLRSMLPSKKLKIALTHLALDLAGAGYGSLVDYQKAESLIRHAEKTI